MLMSSLPLTDQEYEAGSDADTRRTYTDCRTAFPLTSVRTRVHPLGAVGICELGVTTTASRTSLVKRLAGRLTDSDFTDARVAVLTPRSVTRRSTETVVRADSWPARSTVATAYTAEPRRGAWSVDVEAVSVPPSWVNGPDAEVAR